MEGPMNRMREKPLLWFFVITYGLSWGVLGYGFVIAGEMSSIADLLDAPSRITMKALMPYVVVASFGPLVAAFLMIAIGPNPKEALLLWLKGFIRLNVHPFVYLLTLFVLPVIYFLILTVLGVAPLSDQEAALVYVTSLGMSSVNGLATAFMGAGPIGEEPGWRGGVDIAVFLPTYIVGVISLAYVLTKIWRWSHGSIILAIWFHGLVNFTANYPTDVRIWALDGFTDVQLKIS